MEININNYESFIIEYFDNNLGPLETAQLLIFLENHPDLKNEFDGLSSMIIKASPESTYEFKESLKQPADKDAVNLSVNNYSFYFIAATEKDLSAKGYKALNKFLEENPQLQKDYDLFTACKITSDKSITFPGVSQLKKQTKPFYLRYYVNIGIAATILILMSIFFDITPETKDSIDNTVMNGIEQPISNEKVPVTGKETKIKSEISVSKIKKSEAAKPTQTLKKASGNKATKPKREFDAPIKKIEKRSIIMNSTEIISENKTNNFYSGLYDDIRLSQELALAAEEDENENRNMARQPNERTIQTGRFINSMVRTSEQLAEQLPQSMNGWLIADLGMKGFNLITNNNYKIDRQLNVNGKIERLKIKDKDNLY
ncbi:MAG: hypothetical protein WCQ70_05430 [Lentimicrobiaceae bacterium]